MPRTKLDTPAKDRTDWERLRAMPGAEVKRIAAEDEDNPATDESHWANATIGVRPLKVPVNAKFDRDVVDWFKRRGFEVCIDGLSSGLMRIAREIGCGTSMQ